MIEPAIQGISLPRAFLKIGSGTVARHQFALARAFDCQRVICLAQAMTPDLVGLQHDVEAAGARFHCISSVHGLAGLVTATDEILVFADGLLALPEAALDLLGSSNAVLVQPVEAGVAAGFERIDGNLAAAGLMRIPGRLVERLSELPADCDVVSALTRIALQAGVPQRSLPAEIRDGLRWTIVRDEAEAHATESGWIGLYLDDGEPLTPGSVLARLGVKLFGPAILHAGSGGNALAALAGALVLIAGGAGWFGFTTSALFLCAIVWIVRRAAGLVRRVEQRSLALAAPGWPREAVFGWLLDLTLIIILTTSVSAIAALPLWQRAFAPLMLLSLLRLVPRVIDRGWSGWFADRSLLALLLAFAAGAGVLNLTVAVLAAVMALTGILWPAAKVQLTRV